MLGSVCVVTLPDLMSATTVLMNRGVRQSKHCAVSGLTQSCGQLTRAARPPDVVPPDARGRDAAPASASLPLSTLWGSLSESERGGGAAEGRGGAALLDLLPDGLLLEDPPPPALLELSLDASADVSTMYDAFSFPSRAALRRAATPSLSRVFPLPPGAGLCRAAGFAAGLRGGFRAADGGGAAARRAGGVRCGVVIGGAGSASPPAASQHSMAMWRRFLRSAASSFTAAGGAQFGHRWHA